MTELSFKPVATSHEVEQASRPSLSYWQDAGRRLFANVRAMISLFVIVFLLLMAYLGPFIWRVDHTEQHLDKTSQAPWVNRNAILISEDSPWQEVVVAEPTGTHRAPSNIEVVGEARTTSVGLKWDAVPNATAYRIYRHILQPVAGLPLGLPIGETENGTHVSFQDKMDIQQKTYWYSVVALDDEGNEFEEFTSIEVRPRLYITVGEALRLGHITDASNVEPGDTVRLDWHPLGTDYLGRDMLARLIKGAQVSLSIGIVAPLFFIIIGILIGSVSGFFGGVVDSILMRFTDIVIALPFLLFMILFMVWFGVEAGGSGIPAMVVALVLLSWPGVARLVRGEVLQIREHGYVEASRLLGGTNRWLIGRHMIPNTMGVVLVSFTFAVPATIFTEAFLSFIGMGVVPPTPSWGAMCNDGIRTMEKTPHELLFPALFISITVLAFNLLGDGLRDALDARMRARE
ncbi:MAG: ABC transporter permease [Gammaproteobacteria bacterium]|nr:ABC transporter permease [Gammaproteobacteria bacterium]MYF37563.1 ABC transporter permease [Gammaproteobacteria bacterium]